MDGRQLDTIDFTRFIGARHLSGLAQIALQVTVDVWSEHDYKKSIELHVHCTGGQEFIQPHPDELNIQPLKMFSSTLRD